MAAKYLLLAGAAIFFVWAAVGVLGNSGRLTNGGRTHLTVGVIFLVVSACLFWLQRAV
jgi:hypothetical protein